MPSALKRIVAVLCTLVIMSSTAIAGPQSLDGATRANRPLAYDAESGQLIKAERQSLQVSRDGHKWTAINVPPSTKEGGRIASIAVGEDGAWYAAGPGMGVLRSADDGETWEARNDGLPQRNVTALAAHATVANTLYAVLGDGAIYRSEDAGRSWKMVDKGPKATILSLVHSDMEGSMQTGWLFAATDRGVQRSMDCFCLWRAAGQLDSPVHSISFDPRAPKKLYAASEGGLYRSTDGGQSWKALSAPEGISGLAFTPNGLLYAVTEGDAIFRRGEDGVEAWKRIDG